MTIQDIIKQLRGQKCWRPWRGAAYTVYLEFGDKLPNKSGEKELRKGSYTIGLTICPWYVFQEGKLIFSTDSTYKQIDEELKVFLGKAIEDIQLDENKYEATITLKDGITIKVLYSDSRDEWDIITLENEVIVSKDKIDISPAEQNRLPHVPS